MNIQLSGHRIEVTPALKEMTEKKLSHLQRHFERITSIHVTFEVNNEIQQVASATLAVPGHVISAHAESDDMYKTIDLLVHKLMAQLDKYKDRQTEHR